MTRIIDPATIPTPRLDAIRYRKEAEAAERNGNTEQAATFRALEAAAQAATANRVEAIREMLG